MERYDEKLFTLIKRKIEYDYRIEEQELYCSKLSLSMVNYIEEVKRKQDIEKRILERKETLEVLSEEREQLMAKEE